MSDIVVESMSARDTVHVVHSSAQMGCFLIFAVVCALSAMAETAHARLHGRNGSGKREADVGDLPLTATGASRGPGDSSLGISKRDEESGERAARQPEQRLINFEQSQLGRVRLAQPPRAISRSAVAVPA